jgi:drug/metabolite transporter (DMT)-like permease
LNAHYGEFMALLAAFIFSWTSIFFTTAGRRLGVTTVNLFRLPGAALCLTLTHRALTGVWWPADLAPTDHFWIGVSGVIGLAVGDSALFKAFTLIGPRRSMTMMALAPIFTVVVAWFALREHLGLWALAGIVLIIGGVVTANVGRVGTGTFANISRPIFRLGILLALVGSLGQGVGSALAKLGMMGAGAGSAGLDPLGATLVRISWATIAYWLVVLPRQDLAALRRRLRDRRGVGALGVAILMGPYISVWVSLVAIRHTDAGVAQVLLGMVPIFVVVPAWIVYRDRPSTLSLVGIVGAVTGGALLFLR